MGSFSCECAPGWTPDGYDICQNINEVNSSNTDSLYDIGYMIQRCTKLGGCSTDEYFQCVLNLHNCDTNADCKDNVGSFDCECYDGYKGDGIQCMDQDECSVQSETGSSACDNGKICVNEIGFFGCVCPEGTKSSDETCIDIDECAFGADDCHSQALCINNFGSFECKCSDGYVGDGYECVDVDECTFTQTDAR